MDAGYGFGIRPLYAFPDPGAHNRTMKSMVTAMLTISILRATAPQIPTVAQKQDAAIKAARAALHRYVGKTYKDTTLGPVVIRECWLKGLTLEQAIDMVKSGLSKAGFSEQTVKPGWVQFTAGGKRFDISVWSHGPFGESHVQSRRMFALICPNPKKRDLFLRTQTYANAGRDR